MWVLSAGCQRPPAPIELTTQTLDPAITDADALFDAAVETLRQRRFRLDRVDRRERVVTTHPASSQHFFEAWRRDVATAYDWIDSTVNPVRRQAQVRVIEHESGIELEVTVLRQRRSMPDRQFNDAGAAYQFFGYSLPATTGAERITREDETWLSRGRDAAMEARLLDEILSRAAGHGRQGAAG
ncbi:MAG: hypothetical protein C4547_02370 [Phycisphaerales bacterium]|nr:MAG: hypothetical protein C4547_02370 [Phycisphaerales bacterium]